jgi:hypothetical protein
MKFRLSSLFWFVIGASVLAALGVQLLPSTGSGLSRNQVSIENLPQGASDIDYFYSGFRNPDNYYEFNISKSGFHSWASSFSGLSTHELPNKQFGLVIQRYDVDLGTRSTLHTYEGMKYTWVDPNRGDQTIELAYDENIGRAFYYQTSF